MNDRMLEAIKKLKENQDNLSFDLKQLARDFEKSSSLNMQEAILKVADDLARYTIQDGYWYYNGKSTGIKAEGVDGEQGPQGIQGIPGKDGKDGKPGKDGKNGKDGKDGKPGLNGKDGKDGKDGKNGTDGKDGVTPLIKIGKVESSDTYGGADVKMRFGKGNIIYLDFTLPMGRQGFAGLDGKDGAPGKDGEKGEDAKINGVNTLNMVAGSNINLNQEGETLTISAVGGGYIEVDDEIDPESTNPVQNKVIYEDQQRQDDLIEMSFNTLPKITGSNDTINGTSNTPMELELLGNTEQATTTGKNKVNFNTNTQQTINDVVFTPVYENGQLKYINANGTASDGINYYIYGNDSIFYNLPAGTYYLSDSANEESNTTYFTYMDVKNNAQLFLSTISTQTRTYSNDVEIRLRIVVRSGVQLNNVKFYPMLESGSTATDYEPYTNGASPNPDYPQEIHTVTGDNEVDIVGKNLFNYNKTSQEVNGVYFTVNNDKSLTANGTASSQIYWKLGEFYLPKDGTYYMSGSPSNGSASTYRVVGYLHDKNGEYLSSVLDTGTGVSFSGNKGYRLDYYIHIVNGVNVTDKVFKPMISTLQTEYIPYQSQTYPITLGNLEYCKIGDFSDEFILATNETGLTSGKLYLKKNTGKYKFTGNEYISGPSIDGGTEGVSTRFYVTPSITNSVNTNTDLKCTHFKAGGTYGNDNTAFQLNNGTFLIRINYNNYDIDTVAKLTTFLTNNDIYVYYPLATPEYILLNDTLQTELNNIQKAVSYNEQTNIIQINDDLPFIINYSANKNVPTKLSELTNDNGYVKDTDYASSSKGGVIKEYPYGNFGVYNGYPIASVNTYETYQSKGNDVFIGKGTLENVITGKGLTNVAHTNSNNNFSTSQTINGTLTVVGDISQTGTSYETHAEQLFTKNDLIKTRDGAVGGLGNNEVTGIEAIKYDGTNNGRLVFDNTGTARVGDVGDEVPLLARDESSDMVDSKVLTWDSTDLVAKTTIGFVTLTQSEYDDLVSGGTVDADTYYFIEEE